MECSLRTTSVIATNSKVRENKTSGLHKYRKARGMKMLIQLIK
jgi:hypothetical protein